MEITKKKLNSNPIILNITFLGALDMKGDMASSHGTAGKGCLVVVRDILYVSGVGCTPWFDGLRFQNGEGEK